jgi:hypothetical protein
MIESGLVGGVAWSLVVWWCGLVSRGLVGGVAWSRPFMVIMELGIDEWCYIATHVVQETSLRKRVPVDELYAKLFVLCNNLEYRRHLRSEMKWLYLSIHVSWHRYPVELHRRGLDTWSIQYTKVFQFEGKKRCNVLFKNQTVSCLVGFMTRHDDGLTFRDIHYLLNGEDKCYLEKTDVICPVFSKCKTSDEEWVRYSQ